MPKVIQFLVERSFDLWGPTSVKGAIVLASIAATLIVARWLWKDRAAAILGDHRYIILCYAPLLILLLGCELADWAEWFSTTPIGVFRSQDSFMERREIQIQRRPDQEIRIGDLVIGVEPAEFNADPPKILLNLSGSFGTFRLREGRAGIVLKEQCWASIYTHAFEGEAEELREKGIQALFVVLDDRASSITLGVLVEEEPVIKRRQRGKREVMSFEAASACGRVETPEGRSVFDRFIEY